MRQVRDSNSQLSAQEIDAIKITQDIIKRMAENSQKMKTCFLGICAFFGAILGRGVITFDWRPSLAFLILTVVFWVMDARYLALERQFREHHKAIVAGSIPTLEAWNFSSTRYSTMNFFPAMLSFSTWVYPAVAIAFFLIF